MAELLTRCRPLLGTFVEVTAEREDAIEAAFDAMGRVHDLMSAHLPGSDISLINRFGHTKPIEVHEWTAAVLDRSLFWSARSGGAFDIVAAGAAAIANAYLPRHPDQPQPNAAKWDDLQTNGAFARLRATGCIDVGGIAKGFAVDRAIEAMKLAGSAAGLVNAGGDIAAFGTEPWTIGVVDPATRRAIANVAVANGAVATSSVLPDGNGVHLPGRAAALQSATVCAPTAMDADALTKIVLSGSPLAAECLDVAGAQAFVIDRNGRISAVKQHRRAA